MVRANRYFIPGLIWHVTQRCHQKEFLLKFIHDRRRWRYWLFQAKKRYNLRVLDYMITSNHIHLLVYDKDKTKAIPRSLQLIAGRTAQEFNLRKERKGAFWGDRYQATAIENGIHLMRCIIYIDLNMVRAEVVKHPSEWECCGYHDLQDIPDRKKILDYSNLLKLININSYNEFKTYHQKLINDALETKNLAREEEWTKSLAVGSQLYVESIKRKLGIKAQYRSLKKGKGPWRLKEEEDIYHSHSDGKI